MKIKVYCKEENRALYEKMLTDGGFTVSDSGGLSLIEDAYAPEYLLCKENDEDVLVKIEDIVLIESCGRDIVARTRAGTFKIKDTLEHLESILKPARFIRISQSAILQRQSIEKISHGLSNRFHLTLKTGIKADVTRSYYYAFKEFIGL